MIAIIGYTYIYIYIYDSYDMLYDIYVYNIL